MLSCLLFTGALFTTQAQTNLYNSKLFNPLHYMSQLPSLAMPYVNVPIKPSPVITTKVINVVTKYVYKNPVCVKISGKKRSCKLIQPQESVVRKGLVVLDKDVEDDFGIYVQGSETPRPFSKQEHTPQLPNVKDLLIEDRLDQLETILPHYTRRRVFETSTITVTKVKSNNRVTATLLVKNCVPLGYDLCPPKANRKRFETGKKANATLGLNYFN